MNISKRIYKKLSKFALVRKLGEIYLDGFPLGNYLAMKNLEKLHNNNDTHYPINVLFLVQVSELWNKQSPVYEAMKKNDLFNPQIVVIPQYDIVNNRLDEEYKNLYFINNYPSAIKAYDDGEWFDLKELNPDYVFFQRPYDTYLPECYKSKEVSKFTKCCYIPYGYAGSDVFNLGNTNKIFFRNIYMTFLESDYMAKILKKKFKSSVKKKIQFFESLGYPSLSEYFSIKPTGSYKKCLWTPRWSYDPVLGGSNFIKYKDTILKIKNIDNRISLTFRPHPLLFGELEAKNLMNKLEIDEYLEKIRNNDIQYDNDTPLLDTLKNTDVLITDYSSVIIEFFLTGRPIIYCEGGLELNEEYLRMKEGMYVAENEEDLLKYIKSLNDGNDYLFDKRNEILKKYREKHEYSTSSIINRIIDDYNGDQL